MSDLDQLLQGLQPKPLPQTPDIYQTTTLPAPQESDVDRELGWLQVRGKDVIDIATRQAQFLEARKQDPEPTAERYQVAMWLAQQLDMDPVTVYENFDTITAQLAGKQVAPERLWDATKKAWQTGWVTNRIGKLYWQKATGASGARLRLIDAEIEQLRAQLPPDDPVARGLLGNTVKWVAGSLPLWIQGGIEGAKSGLLTAGAAMLASGIAGQGVLAASAASGVGAPAAVTVVGTNMLSSGIYAFGVGTRVGSTLEMSKIMAGLAYQSLEEIKDAEGNRLSPAALSALSVTIGLFQGMVENMQLHTVLAAYPGLDRIVGEGVEQVVKDTVLKTVGNRAVKAAARFGVDALTEGFEEGVQELTMAMGENLANYILNHEDARLFDYNTVNDISQRVRDNFVAGMMAGGAMVLPGHIFSPFSQARGERIDAERHANWQRYEYTNARLESLLSEAETARARPATDPAAMERQTVEPAEPVEDRILEEPPDPDVSLASLQEELRRQMSEDEAWQHTEEDWQRITEARRMEAATVESNVSAFKDIFQPTSYEIRRMIFSAAPKMSWQEVDAAALLVDVLAQAEGVSTLDYARSVFAPGIFAGPEEIATVGERAAQAAVEQATAAGATPEQAQAAAQRAQMKADAAKGVTEFLDDGRALVYLFENADFSTWTHEVGHILRRRLPDTMMRKAAAWAGADPETRAWSEEAEEKFADGLVEYLRQGIAPNQELRTIFQKIAEWLEYIYRAIRDRWALSQDIREVYDSVFAQRGDGGQKVRIDPNPRPVSELNMVFELETAEDPFTLLRQEGVSEENARALLAGKKTAYQVVKETLEIYEAPNRSVRSRVLGITEELEEYESHRSAIAAAIDDAIERVENILKRAAAPIENNPALVPDDQFLRRSLYEQEVGRVYFDELGNQRAVLDKDGRQVPVSSRTTPVPDLALREGMWMVDDTWRGIHGHEIAQLRRFDPRQAVLSGDQFGPGDLVLSEDLVQQNIQGRGWDAERYATWLQQGLTPPPITVVEHMNGHFTVTDGHRRVEAARMNGTPVFAWVWPAMPDPEGRPLRVGMTFEGVKGREYQAGRRNMLFQVDAKLEQRVQKVNRELREFFGTTRDLKKAAYILSTGELLNFDNRWGASTAEMQGGRMVHRMVGKVPTIGIMDSINQALRNQVIRVDYDPAMSIVQSMHQPRTDQWPALRRLAENTDRIMIEYVDKRTGSMLAFEEIEYPTPAKLRSFFNRARRSDPAFLFQTDPFMLKSADVVLQKVQDNMSGEQILRTLSKNGVKPDELHWTGLDEFLEPGKTYRKEDVLKYIGDHAIKLEQVVLGAPRQAITELPEGTERKQMSTTQGVLLIPAPGAEGPVSFEAVWTPEGGLDWEGAEARALRWLNTVTETGGAPQYGQAQWHSPGGQNYREIVFRLPWSERDWTVWSTDEAPREIIPGREPIVRRAQRRLEALHRAWIDDLAQRVTPQGARSRRAIYEAERQYQENVLNTNTRPVQQKFTDLAGTSAMRQQLDWQYKGSHFSSYSNVIGWIRTQDYEIQGKRVFLVDEFQSEWAEKAKHEGFSDPKSVRDVLSVLEYRIRDLRAQIDQKEAVIQQLERQYREATGENQADIEERIKITRLDISALWDEINRQTENAKRMVSPEGRTPAAPFIASKRWGVKIAGEEWVNEKGDSPRFARPEDAEALIKKQGLAGAIVTDMGYVENTAAWAGMEFKRALRWAVEHGYDQLAWTDGATQNRRWRLSNFVDEVRVVREGPDSYFWQGLKDGQVVAEREGVTAAELPGQIGQNMASRVLSDEAFTEYRESQVNLIKRGLAVEAFEVDEPGRFGRWRLRFEYGDVMGTWLSRADAESDMRRINESVEELRKGPTVATFTGLDLELGGEFMRLLYDKIVVNLASKYVKQWGGAVQPGKLTQPLYEVLAFDRPTTSWGINLSPQASLPRWATNHEAGLSGGTSFLDPDRAAVFRSRENAEQIAMERFDPDAVEDDVRYAVQNREDGRIVARYGSWKDAEESFFGKDPDNVIVDRKVAAQFDVELFNFSAGLLEDFDPLSGESTDRFVVVNRGTGRHVGLPGHESRPAAFRGRQEAWDWASENADYLLDLVQNGQRVWTIDITDAMRSSVREGVFPQFLFQPSEHEQSVQEAVVRGDPVPQDVLKQYQQQSWAAEELAARERLVEEARTHEFRDLEEFILFHQTMTPGEPKSPEYYTLIWELAGGDLNVSGEEGFTPLSPAEADKRFLQTVNSPEGLQRWLDIIGAVTYTEKTRKGIVGGAKAEWEKLPRAVRNAGIESARAGVLSTETWKAAYSVMKADPKFYREVTAEATEDPEIIMQLQAERDMPPAEETRLRRENERLRRELKIMREWEKDVIAKSARGKQSWQLTKREWVASWPRDERKPWDFLKRHQRMVQEAVEQDLPVPPEVLADYREARKLYEARRAEGIEVKQVEPPAAEAEPQPGAEVEVTEELEQEGRAIVERYRQEDIEQAQAAGQDVPTWLREQLGRAQEQVEASELQWSEQRKVMELERADLEKQVVHWARRAQVEQRFAKTLAKKQKDLAAVEKRLAVAAIREQKRQRIAKMREEHRAAMERTRVRAAERRQRERQKRVIQRLRAIYARLGHMDKKAAEPIRGILEGIELAYRGQRTVVEIQKLRAELAGEDMEYAASELEKLDLLEKRNIMELTAEEFEQIWRAVQHWVSFNAGLQAMRVGMEQVRQQEAVERAIKEMKPVKEIEENLVRLSPQFWESIKQRGGALWDELLGIGQSQYILIAEQLGGTDSVMYEVLGRQIEEGRRKQLELMQKYEEFFRTELEKLGLSNAAHWLHEETVFTLGRRAIALTRGEKLAMYMMSLDEDARESMIKGGIGSRRRSTLRNRPVKISEDLLNEIATSISDLEQDFVGVVRALFDMTWQDMNPVYEQRYGHPMQRIANWYHKDVMPIGRGSSVEEQKAIEEYKLRKLRPGVPKGRIKERQDVVVPLFVNSIEHDIFEAINYASRYAGLELPVYQAAKLLSDGDFSSELSARYGERTLKHLREGVRDVVAETESLSTIENFFAKTRSMIQIGYLSMNPFSMLKIFMGFANGVVYVDADHLARGFAEFIAHPIRIDQRNQDLSPYYRDRIARGFTRDIAEGLRSMREGALVAARRKLPEIGMRPIQFADRAAVSPVMHAAVLQALDDFQRGELSRGVKQAIGHLLEKRDLRALEPGEKVELAYRFADFVIQRTQDQRLPEYRSALNRASAWGGFVKYFTMFGSNTNTNLNILRRAIGEYQRSGKGRNDVSRLAKVTILTFLAVPMAEAFVNAMRNYLFQRYDEDEDKILSVLSDYLRNVGGLFYFVRDVVDAAVGAIQGRSREFTIPPVQLTNDAFRLIQKGVGLATETDWIERERKMWSFFDSLLEFILMVGELPLLMPKRYVQEAIELLEE